MQIKESFEAESNRPMQLLTREELQQLAEDNRIEDYYQQLRAEHPIDYDQLASTAKSLKTLQDEAKRTAVSYFKKLDNVSSDDEASSNNKNLVDQMLENISRIDYQGAGGDKGSQKKRWWTQEEDEQLKQLVDEHGARNWKRIASFFDERTDVQCLHRWQKVLNPKLIKGPWVILVLISDQRRRRTGHEASLRTRA